MATTFQEYTGDGNATKSFSFPSYQESDVKVRVDGVLKTTSTHYNITSYTTTGGGNVVFTAGNIPSSPAKIRIYRDTNVDAAKATYTAGSSVKAADLNNNNTQLLYRAQEEQVPNLIQSYDLAASAIETSNIKDASITTAKIADDAVTTRTIISSAVTTAKIADNAVTMAKLNSGALPTDITVASANIVDGTIVEADLSNSAITANKIADGTVGTLELANGSVTTDKIAADAVTNAKIADNAIASANISDGNITTTKIADDAVRANHIADSQVLNAAIADNAVSSAKIADGNITTTKIADDAVRANHIDNSQVLTAAIANDAVTIDKIADAAIVTNSEQASHTVNDTTFFTTAAAEARYFNVSSGETIKDGDTFPDNDTTIATTAAINDRIIDIVNDVGGFDIIQSEQHFPNTNPQGQAGSAAVLSIKAASTNLVPSGTTVTISNGNLANNANITITGVTSTIPSGFGFIVESTNTLHTYTFHRLVPKATEVTTVAGKATEIGRLGTAAAVEDMSILGTTDVVADMAILGTNDVVADMNLLATSDVVSDMNTLAVADVLSDLSTVADSVTNVNNVGNNITNVNSVSNSAGANQTFTVTVQDVSGNKYFIDGVQTPVLKLARGKTYTFDMSDSSNSGHPLAFKDGSGNSYTTGVTTNGTAGISGATVVIVVAANAPSSLRYYCTSHGNSMGNTITVIDDNVGTVAGSISNVNTVSGAISNVNTTAGSISNVNTVASNISNVNSFFNVYRIGSSNPTSSLDVGDLFFNTTSNSLKVYTGSAWVDGVTTTGDFALKTGNTFTGSNIHNDNVKSIYGTGSDFEIYHDGTHTYLDNTTGDLRITDTGGGGIVIGTDSLALRNSARNENYLTGNVNGSVELYYNNALRLSTTANGVTLGHNLFLDNATNAGRDLTWDPANDQLQWKDNTKASFGSGSDLQIYHDGTDNIISNSGTTLAIYRATTNAGNSVLEVRSNHGATGQVKFKVDGDGDVLIPTDNGRLQIGAGQDFQIYHDGSHTRVSHTGTGQLVISGNDNDQVKLMKGNSEEGVVLNNNGNVELYFDNAKKFETTSTGAHVLGTLEGDNLKASNPGNNALLIQNPSNGIIGFGANNQTNQVIITTDGHLGIPTDTGKLRLGAGEDLEIYHDGSNSYIADVGTGELRLRGTTIRLTDHNGTENFANFIDNGATELFYDNAKKFETKSTGVTVSSSANAEITLTSATSGSATLEFGDTDDDSVAQISYNNYNGFMMYRTSDNADMRFYTNNTHRLTLHKTGYLAPATDSAYDLGTSSVRFANAYVDTYYGDGSNLTGINTDLVSDTSPQLGGNLDTNGNAILLGDTSDTATATADDRIRIGASQDLQLFHGPNNSYIRSTQGSFNIEQYANATLDVYSNHDVRLRVNAGEMGVDCSHNGSVELYYDNSLKLGTESAGVYVYGDLLFGVGTTGNLHGGDNDKVMLGSGNDLQLYHDGSNSYITNSTGILHLRGVGNGIRLQKSDGEPMIYAIADGEVQLYYDQTEKAKTASHGMYFNEAYLHHHVNSGNSSEIRFTTANVRRGSVYADNGNTVGFTNPSGGWSARWHSDGKQTSHGHIWPNANNTYDLGDNTYRWRNVYTNDLHLSNEGSSNDVDGTWGDWTIQEGESDLFLKNNRSGKKYKFNLMEVS